MSDLYVLLGLDATNRERVTAADVKKAYRQEALKWHPDKHPPEARAGAEARFKDLAHAFEILSDSGKRALYDRGGMDAVERGAAMPSAAEEFEATRHYARPNSGSDRPGSSRHRHNAHPNHTSFRDPFELFNSMFQDMHRMMGGPSMGHLRGGFGSVFDDPFFSDPFGSDPFFASTVGSGGFHSGGSRGPMGFGMFGPQSGMLFGPSLLSAFGTGSGFATGFHGPFFPPPLQHQQYQPQPQQPPLQRPFFQAAPSSGRSATTTQMFSLQGSAHGPQQGSSITVETRVEDGQRVTRTVHRRYMPDGTVREEVSGPRLTSAQPQPRHDQIRYQHPLQQQQQPQTRQVPAPSHVAAAVPALHRQPTVRRPQLSVPIQTVQPPRHVTGVYQPSMASRLSSTVPSAPRSMRSATTGGGTRRGFDVPPASMGVPVAVGVHY